MKEAFVHQPSRQYSLVRLIRENPSRSAAIEGFSSRRWCIISGMAERAQAIRDKDSARTMAAVQLLLSEYPLRDFAVELWDGTRLDPEPGQFCRFTWRINNPGALRALLRSDRQVALGEAYIFGDFDISGDILACFGLAEHLAARNWSATEKLKLGSRLLGLPSGAKHRSHRLQGRVHSKSRDREA